MIFENAAATTAFGMRLGAVLRQGDAVGLSGPLGAGKTVLARAMLRALGFTGDVPSPSYPLVIAYELPTIRIDTLHVDLYRIDHGSQLDELGLDDARPDAVVLVEWPERLGAVGWCDMLRLTLGVTDHGARVLTAQIPPAWDARWPPQ